MGFRVGCRFGSTVGGHRNCKAHRRLSHCHLLLLSLNRRHKRLHYLNQAKNILQENLKNIRILQRYIMEISCGGSNLKIPILNYLFLDLYSCRLCHDLSLPFDQCRPDLRNLRCDSKTRSLFFFTVRGCRFMEILFLFQQGFHLHHFNYFNFN